MEFSTIKVNGSEVTVIYNGRYFSFARYFGLVGLATRTGEDERGASISVRVGNHHTVGTMFISALNKAFRRCITKMERRYISDKNVVFTTDSKLLEGWVKMEFVPA